MKRPKFYAVTHDILGDVFWDVFRKGLFDAAEKFDVDVEHLRPGRFSPEIQAGMIEAATKARPDGIISTIPDIAAVDAPLRTAVAAGIPVIAVNARDTRSREDRIPYEYFIGGDDEAAGSLAARYLIANAAPRAALCIDHYLYDHICHTERWNGFRDAMEAAGRPAERLRVPGGGASCARVILKRLLDRPDFDAVLTLGPPGAEAALQAVAEMPSGRLVRHLTFDVADLQLQGIRTGAIMATLDSQQYLQGFLAVQGLWMLTTMGFSLSSDVLTGPAIVDAAGLAAAERGVALGFR